MTNRLDPSDDDYGTFVNLPSLEQQAIYIVGKVAIAENIFNTGNPQNLQNRATIATNYDARTVTVQVTLNLTDVAAFGPLYVGCLPYLP